MKELNQMTKTKSRFSHVLNLRTCVTALLVLTLFACGSGGGPTGSLKGGGSGGGGGGNKGGGNKGGGNKGGGNKGGGNNGGGTNQGSYKLEEFHYKDKLPQGYHPFGKNIYKLRRDELAVFVDNYASRMDGLVMDDDDKNHQLLPPIPAAFPPKAEIFDSAGGQLDADPSEEVVAVALYPVKVVNRREFFDLKVRVYGTNYQGQRVEDQQFSVGVPALNATLRLADVDGDGRDEIILACATGTRASTGNKYPKATGAALRVFDDRVGGFKLLFKADHSLASKGAWEYDGKVAAGDLDGDGKAEIAFLERRNQDQVVARVFDDAGHSFKAVKFWTNKGNASFLPYVRTVGNNQASYIDLDVVAGDFDGDGSDELVFLGVENSGGPQINMGLYDGMDAKKSFAFLGTPKSDGWKHVRYTPFSRHRSWQAFAVDLDGNGTDALMIHAGSANGTSAPGRYDVELTQWVFNQEKDAWSKTKETLQVTTQGHAKASSRAAVFHDVFEKKDRVVVAMVNHDSGRNAKLEMYRIGKKNIHSQQKLRFGLKVEKIWTQALQASSKAVSLHTPMLAAADLQGDGLVIAYTNKKVLALSDPVPICLMAAPPTKAGISQNYDDTEVSYGKSRTTTVTHTTSATTTLSGEVGLSADFKNAFYSFDVRATYEKSIERAHGTSKSVTKTVTFVGGHEEDYIIFEGVVYRSYIYKILAARDTSLIGKKISIDVPVQSRVYKWTLSYYNKTVKPEARIDRSQVFKHRVGDPVSYLNESEARGKVNNGRGWLSPPQTVGQGTRVNEASVDIEKSNSTEETRTITTGVQGEIQIGPFVAGASYGIGNTGIYSIEIGLGAHFAGTIGDIQDRKDFSAWNYAFGVALYKQRGGKGKKRGFQVLNFWVDPTGTAY